MTNQTPLGGTDTVKVINADGTECTVKLRVIGIASVSPAEPVAEPVAEPE